MAGKKRKKRFQAVKAVKAAARETIGTPPPTKREPRRRVQATEKHRPTLGKLLAEE
jgi:hypothetical protein